jgi:hypothetical protein
MYLRDRATMLAAIVIMACVLTVPKTGQAKTVEAGDATTSWMGKGEVIDVGEGRVVISGTLKGVMVARHYKGAIRGPIHVAKLECPVRVDLDKKNNRRDIVGICTLVAHEGKDVAYAQFKCAGGLDECEGDFTFTGGTGGFNGISGTTPVILRLDVERLEDKKGEAFGYAHWPNLTYNLP